MTKLIFFDIVWTVKKVKKEVVKIIGKNKDGVPGHWEDIHRKNNHPGNFSDGCEICLQLFENPKVIPAVRSV